MHFSSLFLLSAVTLTSFALVIEAGCNRTCAQNALTFSYQYGYPLASYARFAKGRKVNNLYHSPALATAENKTVVRPNADTVYSGMVLDLSQQDLLIAFDSLDNWYWLFSFYDPYGNNYANFGSFHNYKGGTYRLRYTNTTYGMKTSSDTQYQAYIDSPTPHGLLLIRVAVYDANTDYPTVHRFQNSMQVKTAPRSFDMGNIPALDSSIFDMPSPPKPHTEDAHVVLNLTSILAPWNEPLVRQDRNRVQGLLEDGGIRNGTFIQPNGTDLNAAQATADGAASSIHSRKPESLQDLGNHWHRTADNVSGNFSTSYAARQNTASVGFLQLVASEAIYPLYNPVPGNSTILVKSDEAVVFTFSKAPKVNNTGFWSMTAYGNDEFFIPNRINRYLFNSGSNMTHPDGTLVKDYGDKPFQIVVQPADRDPGGNWTNNWLPGPSGGGAFYISLRIYGALPSATNGSYQYPVVTTLKAFGSNATTPGSPTSIASTAKISHASLGIFILSLFCFII